MTRDQHLLQIRPQLDTDDERSLPGEVFQNEVLRPIIKFQSDHLFQVMQHYIRTLSPDFRSYDRIRKKEFIRNSIQKDHRLHAQLIGMITALFTSEELTVFLQDKSQHGKRITQIITERFHSQLEKLSA